MRVAGPRKRVGAKRRPTAGSPAWSRLLVQSGNIAWSKAGVENGPDRYYRLVDALDYVPRLVDNVLDRYVGAFPALLITGPRATGKTTTARRYARSVVRLDAEAEAVAFRADPDASLRAFPEPVLLDEWQAVPGVLGAVKRAVDEDPRPGRFILTGSVRADLDHDTWPGTGLLVRVPMYGLTVREMAGALHAPTFVEKLAEGDLDRFTLPAD